MYSGILRTFSSNFDVVLELPHRTDPPPTNQAVGLKIVADKMIFKFDSIVKIAAYDTDLDSMTRSKYFFNFNLVYNICKLLCCSILIYTICRYIPNWHNY